MKNSLNEWHRPRMTLIDYILLPVGILLLPLFLVLLTRVNKEMEEKERYAEKRRGGLVNWVRE